MHPKYAASFRTSVRCRGTIDVNTADSTRTARLLERWRAPPRYSILTMTNKMARVSNWSPEYITLDHDLPDFLFLLHLHLSVMQGTFAVIWFATYAFVQRLASIPFTNVIGQQKCM